MFCATILVGSAATPALAQATPPAAQETSLASAAPASAADADANAIVVTATRRKTTLQDAPINISAVSSDTLAKNHIDDVKSLGAFVPGMTIVDTGPGSSGDIILRGIASTSPGTNGTSSNSAVGVYLGEVPMYLDFKLLDISRVEVLEGPQGTLYGLGTLAGAVRYIPNRPDTDHWSFDFHARGFDESHASTFGADVDGTLNIPIVADHIAFRSVTGYYDDPGFINYDYLLNQPGISNPQPVRGTTAAQAGLGGPADYAANFHAKDGANFEHTFTTRNQLLFELNPDAKLYLTYAHQTTKTDGRQANGAGVLGTGDYVGPWRYLEPVDRKSDLYAAEFNFNLGHIAQLVATTAYTNQKIFTQGDNTDLLLDLNYGYEAFPAFSSYNQSTEYTRQFNEEARLVSTHGGPFSWVIGGFYNNLRDYRNYHEITPGYANFIGVNRPDDLEFIEFVNTQTKEKAAYGEGTFHITKAWQVTGGIRYYNYDASAIGATDTPLTSGGLARTPYPLYQFAPSRIASGATGSDGVVWKANTSYKFSNNLLAYFTYSTGYRTGNVNRVAGCVFLPDGKLPPGQNVCALPNELAYGPDRTRNAEIGIRASLFDKRLQFSLDGFHINWNDIQIPSKTVNGAVGITVNGGKAVSQGFEFSGSFKITPQLVLQGTYAYTDAHLTQNAPGVVVTEGVTYEAFAGDRLPGSTKNSGSAQLSYTYPLGDGRDIEANWAATYTGDIYSIVGLRGFGQDIPGYITHRASVTYHAKKFEVGIFADNIFDKYAITAISNTTAAYDQTRTGVVERYYAQSVLTPRTVGVDLRVHY